MAIADDLEKLASDLSDAYDVIETKGGTIPEHKNTDNLPDAISSIEGGGASMTCKTPYGRLWYAPFEETWNVDYVEGCTVTIDSVKFSAYVVTNPIQSWDPEVAEAEFYCNPDDGTWDSWSFQNPIMSMTTADMATQLGITVVLTAGADGVSFRTSLTVEPVVGAEWASVDLSSSELNNIKNGYYDNSFTAGGKTIYCDCVRRFEFGTVEQKNLLYKTDSRYFLANTGISEVSIIPDNIKGVARSPLVYNTPNFNYPLIFGPKIFEVVLNFPSGSIFNQPILFDPDIPTAEERAEYRIPSSTFPGTNGDTITLNGARDGTRELFNKPIALGNNVEGFQLVYMYNFDQPLVLPSGLKVLILTGCEALNQDLTLPQGLTKFQMIACNNFTSTINVGNLSPANIASSDVLRTLMFGCEHSTDPGYVQGIKIAGANRQEWLTRFPNKSSGGWAPYRRLIDAGY